MADDSDLFVEMMRGKVQRLQVEAKRAPRREAPRPQQVVTQRAVRPAVVASAPAEPLQATDDPWTWRANGISRERLKRLAAGRPAVAATFDLHGMTRDEALAHLEQRFADAIAAQMRVVCLIHGRGLHSQGRPVLKQAVYHWLKAGSFAGSVLAIIPQPGSGGGACLVLLRAAEKMG